MAARFTFVLVLALTCLAGSALSAPPKCPPPGTETIYFPDDESCTHYYVCSNGWPTRMECPPGLHFDAARNVCNTPSEANCNVVAPPTPTVPAVTTGLPEITPTPPAPTTTEAS